MIFDTAIIKDCKTIVLQSFLVLSDLVFVCIVAIIGLKKLLVVLNAVLVIVILNCRLYSFLGEYLAVNLYCRQSVKCFDHGFVCKL